jgi:hypothetical protein
MLFGLERFACCLYLSSQAPRILSAPLKQEQPPSYKSSLKCPRRRQGQGAGLGLERHSVVSFNPEANIAVLSQ